MLVDVNVSRSMVWKQGLEQNWVGRDAASDGRGTTTGVSIASGRGFQAALVACADTRDPTARCCGRANPLLMYASYIYSINIHLHMYTYIYT